MSCMPDSLRDVSATMYGQLLHVKLHHPESSRSQRLQSKIANQTPANIILDELLGKRSVFSHLHTIFISWLASRPRLVRQDRNIVTQLP